MPGRGGGSGGCGGGGDFDVGSSLLLATATLTNLIVKGMMKCFGMMIVLLVSYYGPENISEYELSFCPGIAYTMFSCGSKYRFKVRSF